MMWALLRREWDRQMQDKAVAGESYIQMYITEEGFLNDEHRGMPVELVNRYPDGNMVKTRVTQHSNKIIRQEIGYENFDFHSLRHTHATELSEAGVNLKEIQRRLGHKNLEITTRRYIHATDLMQEQSVDIMNAMYGEEMGEAEVS